MTTGEELRYRSGEVGRWWRPPPTTKELTTMPRATAPPITLTAVQRAVLDHLVRAGTTPQQVAQRAQVVLAAAAGMSTGAIARTWALTWRTAQRWRARWDAAQDALLAAEAEGGPGDDR